MARVTAVTEMQSAGRVAGTALRSIIGIFLVAVLWGALYMHTPNAAGVSRGQAMTYAVVAAMLTYLRAGDRMAVNDALVQHVYGGTLIYWFLRPMPPRRYYFVRACGDLGYGMAWAATGFSACLALGVIEPPVSFAAGGAFAISLFLGQVITYQLMLLVDLVCFWTVVNQQVVMLLMFAQTLLSGGFAPLWFFPDWFQALSSALPFQGIISIPISLYTGRIPVGHAARELAVQAAWCSGLGLATRLIWRKAAKRVQVHGG
ncbi:ABC-2 family transporter protein [Nonomuraea sp. NPDC050643]|uniref:ABC transporter permease n=1 Tax=Nonomuraea sp. NPDC050643 TaxID=3155660 RepID=UPI0033F8F36E